MQVATLLRSAFGHDIQHARLVAILFDDEPDHLRWLGVEHQLVGARRARDGAGRPASIEPADDGAGNGRATWLNDHTRDTNQARQRRRGLDRLTDRARCRVGGIAALKEQHDGAMFPVI